MTREYTIWRGMLVRCLVETSPHYAAYGGRGIDVCERWRDFTAFLADMGECPAAMSLDRIDNDGNYEPSNCRWATATEQQRNTRRSRSLTINGVTKSIREWADESGIDRRQIASRIDRYGWTPERAVSEPVVVGHNRFTPS